MDFLSLKIHFVCVAVGCVQLFIFLKGKLHFDPVPHTTCLIFYAKSSEVHSMIHIPGNWNGVVVIKNGNKNGNIYCKTHLCKSLQHDVDGDSHNVSKHVLQVVNLHSCVYCIHIPISSHLT